MKQKVHTKAFLITVTILDTTQKHKQQTVKISMFKNRAANVLEYKGTVT